VANVESPEALVTIAFEVPGAAAFEGSVTTALGGPGVAALEVPGVAAFEVPEAAAFEGSVTTAFEGPAAFDGMVATFEGTAAAFEGPENSAAAVLSCSSLIRMPLSGLVAEGWNSVLSGGDVGGECWGVLKNTQNIKLLTRNRYFFSSDS
jgi:hypothetical protein